MCLCGPIERHLDAAKLGVAVSTVLPGTARLTQELLFAAVPDRYQGVIGRNSLVYNVGTSITDRVIEPLALFLHNRLHLGSVNVNTLLEKAADNPHVADIIEKFSNFLIQPEAHTHMTQGLEVVQSGLNTLG